MRILRLDLDDGEELDLHPYVTVLGGLAPGIHRRVVDRLARLAHGDASGGPGLVEAHDVLTEVSEDALAGLSLDPASEVVVRAVQLPGASIDPNSVDGTSHAAGEIDARADAARTALAHVEVELASAADAVRDATEALDAARRGLDDFAITAHDGALAALAAAEAEAASAGADTPVVDVRSRLVAELETARRDSEAHDAELQTERLALLELLEALEAERQRLAELTARRDSAGSGEVQPARRPPSDADIARVTRALDVVRAGPPPPPRVPSPQATDLADRIAAHESRHDTLEAELREEGVDVVALQDELVAAQLEVRVAEEAARPNVIAPEDDAEIERLHDIVVDQSEKKGSRRGGKGAERAYDEAAEALDGILERVGYPTYAAYVMGRIAPSIDPDARRRHEEALARVEENERRLDEAARLLENDNRVLVLRAERDQLWAEARDTLGTLPDDVEGALRALRIDGEVEFTAVADLQVVLESVGVPSPSADEVAVVATAETFLADAAIARAEADTEPGEVVDPLEVEIRSTETRLGDLYDKSTEGDETLTEWEAESERLSALAAAAEAALASHDLESAESDSGEPQVAWTPEVAKAHEQVALTEARLARHRAAVEQVDDRHAELRSARSLEREVEARRDAARTRLESVAGEVDSVDDTAPLPEIVWDLDGEDIEPLEWYLLGRVAALRQVSHAGSVPLVLDDTFRGLPEAPTRALCQALARIGESVQVVYVGDSPWVAAWASEKGLDHAAVVRPGQPAL